MLFFKIKKITFHSLCSHGAVPPGQTHPERLLTEGVASSSLSRWRLASPVACSEHRDASGSGPSAKGTGETAI